MLQKTPHAIKVWLAYFLLVSLFILQLPLNGSLPGNWDTWLYLYLFNYYPDYLSAKLGMGDLYLPFFPESSPPFLFGEPSFFNSLVFLPLQWVTRSPLWGYYLFIASILALNGTALHLLTRQLFKSWRAAWLSGILWMFSNYMLSSLDQQNVLSAYPAIFSLYFLMKYGSEGRGIWILTSALWAAIQVYCSAYHFMFYGITLICLSLIYWRSVQKRLSDPWFHLSASLVALLVLPFVVLYLAGDVLERSYNAVDIRTLESLSLHFRDLISFHPYNTLFGSKDDASLLHYIHSVAPGFILLLMAAMGWFSLDDARLKLALMTILLLGLSIAMGPVWHLGDVDIQSPVFVALDLLRLDQWMRTPVRAYMMVLLVLVLLSAYAWEAYWKGHSGMMMLLLALWGLENLPYRLQEYDSWKYLNPPSNLAKTAALMRFDEVLWIIPGNVYEGQGMKEDMDWTTREYIYMYWQTQFKRNMVNGMNGYVPLSNLEFRQDWHYRLDSLGSSQVGRRVVICRMQ